MLALLEAGAAVTVNWLELLTTFTVYCTAPMRMTRLFARFVVLPGVELLAMTIVLPESSTQVPTKFASGSAFSTVRNFVAESTLRTVYSVPPRVTFCPAKSTGVVPYSVSSPPDTLEFQMLFPTLPVIVPVNAFASTVAFNAPSVTARTRWRRLEYARNAAALNQYS